MRLAAAAVGVLFGFALSWAGTTDPDAIRNMLLLDDLYLWGMFAVAVATATVGVRLLRRRRARALVGGEPIAWETQRPQSHHLVGSVIFGIGWAISNACPGPIAAQLGQGFAWGLFTMVGVLLGIELFFRLERGATVPADPRATVDSAWPKSRPTPVSTTSSQG
ncbi:MAG: DUF6691 family protein [Solirubrobacteraceae bacterium]